MAKATNKQSLTPGLSRQRAFLDKQKENKGKEESFFVTEKVMESMRDSGYRDIRKALNDLIDNSKQAGAKKIAVVTTAERENGKNAREKISNIAVIDDGHGMFPEMLPIAVKWGGTDRYNERDGLGRFGFGLPTASVSISRVYEVYSKISGGEWHKITVDLNEIAKKAISGNISHTPEVTRSELPSFVQDFIKKNWERDNLEQGTVIWLRKPDRIRRFSLPTAFQSKMMQNIGLTYRHYMPDIAYWVNDKKVEMIDPLFQNPNCMAYDIGTGLKAEGLDDMVIRVKNPLFNGKIIEGDVRLRFSVMHPRFQRDKDGGLNKSRYATMKENNGYFIVCRNGRQIDIVREPYYQSEDDNITIINYDANWAIELDFDPILDEMFGITTNKQQVELDAYLWDLFKEHNLPATIASLRKRLQTQRVKDYVQVEEKKEEKRDSEQIMSDAERFDKKNVPQEKQEQAEEILLEDAKEKAKAENKKVEDVVESLAAEAENKKFKIEFTELPGAPFYDVELWGQQTRIKINTGHRFYTDIYAEQDSRGKTAIELLLFVLGRCEAESNGDKGLFYGNERYEWSRRLELRLKILDKKNPILDKQASADEKN
jgi:hypothetical protein